MHFKETAHHINTALESKDVPCSPPTKKQDTYMFIGDLIKTIDLSESTDSEIRETFKGLTSWAFIGKIILYRLIHEPFCNNSEINGSKSLFPLLW